MFLQVFFISGLISFFGTISPATINLTVLQLSLTNRTRQALSLALGASIVDTIYAALSVKLASYLEQHLEFSNYFLLIAAVVLLLLGAFFLLPQKKTKAEALSGKERLGFMQGLLLGLLNPLAMPFWLGWTSVLQMGGWINVEGINYWFFVLGAFVGEIGLLILIVKIGERFTRLSENRLITNIIPGVILIVLGLFNLITWLSFYW